ncbi:MAG TPA: folate-binding protein [Candidatus Omnitrophota bacterium]|nr:folate-binding protein [Candidatus Omnitrophota bacterium]
MADKSYTPLAHRALLVVGGDDRRAFLQGLISNDTNKLAADRAIFGAFLTPQGKFLHDLFLAERGDEFLIEAEADRIEDFRKKLSMYKLRSKVTVAMAEGLSVFAAFGDGAASALDLPAEAGAARRIGDGVAFVDPRLAAAGLRAWLPDASALSGFAEAPFAAWDQMRMELGLPDGSRDLPVEKAILLENGFDELNGVDFQKGCYMGQELTARTKHRGLVRKRLMPVRIDGPVPEPGTPVIHGDAEAGEMRSVSGSVGLALIRLEHFRAGGPFTCGAATVTPSKPDWAVFPEE